VEADLPLFPLNACGSSGIGAPHPPLRQAAGVLCDIHPSAVQDY